MTHHESSDIPGGRRSSPPVVHDATMSISNTLRAAMNQLGHRNVTLVLDPPRDEIVRSRLPALSVYLHYVEKSDEEGPSEFRLHYLISAWAGAAGEEQILFSAALRALLLKPTLQGDELQGESFDADEMLPLVLSSRLAEGDLSRFWSALGQPPRPTIQCWTSVTALRPEDTETSQAPVVRERELRFARHLR